MHPYSLIVMVTITLFSLQFIRSFAPYKETSKLKYISLNNDFLIKCLVPKQKSYVKVNDRKKISLFSLVLYLLFTFLVLVLVMMFVLPDIPCETFVALFGKRGRAEWEINTLNEKLAYLLTFLFHLTEWIAFFAIGVPRLIKNKSESPKSLCGICAVLILFIGLFVFLIFQFF